jgi:hypothetical protein
VLTPNFTNPISVQRESDYILGHAKISYYNLHTPPNDVISNALFFVNTSIGRLGRAFGLMPKYIGRNASERWIAGEDATSSTVCAPWSVLYPTQANTLASILEITSNSVFDRRSEVKTFNHLPSLTIINTPKTSPGSEIEFTAVSLPLKPGITSRERTEVRYSRSGSSTIRTATAFTDLKSCLATEGNNATIHTLLIELFSEEFPAKGRTTLDITSAESIYSRAKAIDNLYTMVNSTRLKIFEGINGLPYGHTPALAIRATRNEHGFSVRTFLFGIEITESGEEVMVFNSMELFGKYDPNHPYTKGKIFISKTDIRDGTVREIKSTGAFGSFSVGRDRTTILEPSSSTNESQIRAYRNKFPDTEIPDVSSIDTHLSELLVQFSNVVSCFRFGSTQKETKHQKTQTESTTPGSAIIASPETTPEISLANNPSLLRIKTEPTLASTPAKDKEDRNPKKKKQKKGFGGGA